MKANKSSRCWKVLAIMSVMLIGCGYGFNVWLRNYSSILVVGPAEKTHESSPDWSPNGKYVVLLCGYSYPSDGWDIRSWNNPMWSSQTSEVCIVDLETKQTLRLTKFGRDKHEPIWSPNGKAIAWTDSRKNAITIYDFENHKTQANLKRSSSDCPYFWSQDSQRLLSSCGEATLELSTMKLSNSPTATVARQTLLSPNEKYMAYIKEFENTDDIASPALQTYHEKFDSNPNILLVVQNGAVVYKSDYWIRDATEPALAWSPNGEILVFRKYVEDFSEPDIVFLHVPTGRTTLLESDGIYPLFWSPSGRRIAYKTDEDTVELIGFEFQINPFSFTITDRQSFPLSKSSKGDSFSDQLVWSPDENQIAIAYHKYERSSGEAIITYPSKVWLVNLKTGAQTPLVDTP